MMDIKMDACMAWLRKRKMLLCILLAVGMFGLISVLVLNGHVKRAVAGYILTPEEVNSPGSARQQHHCCKCWQQPFAHLQIPCRFC